MKAILVASVLQLVNGCELFTYKDFECKEESFEVEQKVTKDDKAKYTYSARVAWIPGKCLKFGEPIEITEKVGDADKTKMMLAATWGIAGSGQQGGSYHRFGELNADGDNACVYNHKKYGEKLVDDLKNGEKMFGYGSIQGYDRTNICQASIGGAMFQTKSDGLGSKDGFSQRILCGPVPGAVWGIILGSIGLVLSFAGIGLGAAAGK